MTCPNNNDDDDDGALRSAAAAAAAAADTSVKRTARHDDANPASTVAIAN